MTTLRGPLSPLGLEAIVAMGCYEQPHSNATIQGPGKVCHQAIAIFIFYSKNSTFLCSHIFVFFFMDVEKPLFVSFLNFNFFPKN
jgi:hypothetical protein